MDLDYGPNYESLRQEVRQFIAEHGHLAPVSMLDLLGGDRAKTRAWQELLIARGAQAELADFTGMTAYAAAHTARREAVLARLPVPTARRAP